MGDLPQDSLGRFVSKIRGESYRITDDDIENLLSAGFSQDAIFEVVIAAALGAAKSRLDAGLRALEG